MKKILKRMSAILLILALMAVYMPLSGGHANAESYYSFSKPTAGATFKSGSKVTVKFWAGVQDETAYMDAWGQYDHTEYGEMHPTLKVFKGSTEIYSEKFTYTKAQYLTTTFVPKCAGTLKLCVYGRNPDLSGNEELQITTTIKVKKAKPSYIKKVKPEIIVERTAKTKACITCITDYGYGMMIYRAASKNGKYKLIKKTTKSTFTDTKLSAKKTYYYKIKLYAKSGKKTYKSKWSAKTQVGKYTDNIRLTNTPSGVKVSWKAIKGVDFYLIRRSTSGVPGDDVQALCYDSCDTEFIDDGLFLEKGLEKGKTYYYTVEGCKDDGTVIKKYSGKQYKIKIQ